MSGFRVSQGGMNIDRSIRVDFTFDGKSYHGYDGDTLASALLASGVTVFGRSFKYHRPRGLFAAGVDEPNALVTVIKGDEREPNVRATELEIYDGLDCVSQNRFPSLELDLMAVNQLAGKSLQAGFYYKTFMGPVIGPLKGTRFWMMCEKIIRRAAGLGRPGTRPDSSHYERVNAFCDVLVVGAGLSGLEIAHKEAAKGKNVIVCELEARLGGQSSSTETQRCQDLIAKLESRDNVNILRRTTVWGYYDDNTLAAVERVTDHLTHRAGTLPRHRYWVFRAGHVHLATGGLERSIVFPGNDRPGVMLASAAVQYADKYAALAGRKMVIFTNNDSAYASAHRLEMAGADVRAIIDVRPVTGEAATLLANQTGARLLSGSAIIETKGRTGLSGVVFAKYDHETGRCSGSPETIECDLLAVSGGWSPSIHLASQAGAKPQWDDGLQAFLPPRQESGKWTAHGMAAGKIDFGNGLDPNPAPVFEIRAKGKAFVDFQHDVTADDVRLAHREGFVSVEHLKRYTTLGMATDQGKIANVPGLAIMADSLNKPIPEVGTTRFRPPYTAASIGSIAAERYGDFAPHRLTPMHDWHIANSATMQASGIWERPQAYTAPGETIEQAYIREARAVRNGVGIVDVSTLGKIDIQGPDAAEFLNRVYTNGFAKLPVGKARYGLMLREDGVAFDDGTTWRLEQNRFLMTTTTTNAGRVMQHLEFYHDVYFRDLAVNLTSVTDCWAGAAVAGPKSRDVLAACVTVTEVDDTALPFMGIVYGTVGEVPVMICRLSFSGERAYEVYCGAHHGSYVWEKLMAAGEPFGITPYGLEALGTLRIEKGHVTGAEIDGRTTARDLHLDWMLSSKKPFVGSAMMDREGLNGDTRWRLVGIHSLSGEKLHGGSHIVKGSEADEPGQSLGHITAICYSPELKRYIGLALLEDGNNRVGDRLYATDPVRTHSHIPVEIVSHHMVDPQGERMHG